MNNGFDFNKWNDDVQKFTKNQKNMEAKIAITTTNEGKIAVQVVNMKQEYLKYKEQLQKLAIKIALILLCTILFVDLDMHLKKIMKRK